MRLKEYEGKKLLDEYGIEVPRSIFIDASNIAKFDQKINFLHTDEVVVKAQILSGGRKKAGLVVAVPKANAEKSANSLFKKEHAGLTVKELLVEEKLEINKEYYLSLTIDRHNKSPVLIFCKKGGIDIEEAAKDTKVCKSNFIESDFKILMENAEKSGIPENVLKLLKQLYNIFVDKDAILVEINPLIVTKQGKLIAADAKVIIDDNALFRQKEFIKKREEQLTESEQKAFEYGIQYVDLEGDVAVIGNGAGLVMATLDLLSFFGSSPSCFLDVGGGASAEVMERSLEIALIKNPRGIVINIFGGITHCDEIAQGIIKYKDKASIRVPMAVRIIGTGDLKARTLLKENNIYAYDSMEECVKRIVELVK